MHNYLFKIFICKTKFHPLMDLQLKFKSEKFKLNETWKILESKTKQVN